MTYFGLRLLTLACTYEYHVVSRMACITKCRVTAHDVLAISLRAVLYYLGKNAAMRVKVRAEIREAELAGKLSLVAQQRETSDLEYVNAVIMEALRIHPSTGLMFERYVPAGGVVLHDKFIPAGTTIGVNAWVFNRDKDIFGEDSDVFRPERWIESNAERVKEMRRYMFTFSTGSRACIGKHLAMMETTKLILPDPNHEWDVGGNWLTTQTNMDMIFTKRPVSNL
ncbi:hypothetical protein KVR01_001504 [Diaporthe batatas]|uniref:uncharacterized protein n=1 Tax=Diaporthe batatas TaxID=748121 RepID=UPI001D05B542|nr:uncharacterized protein KVR01_001504 [Diaporthe batatas]KAG8168755.1 hypothetical protein KVR01_001504 [Diaporthe batatas]